MMGKTARKAQLDEEIAEHKKDIETLEGEQTSADETRATEHEAYATRTAKLSKAISAMERAIEAMQASKGEMTDAKAGYTGLIAKYRHVILNSIALADSMGLVHAAVSPEELQAEEGAGGQRRAGDPPGARDGVGCAQQPDQGAGEVEVGEVCFERCAGGGAQRAHDEAAADGGRARRGPELPARPHGEVREEGAGLGPALLHPYPGAYGDRECPGDAQG